MSGIRSTSGTPPTPPVDAGRGTATAQQQVSPVDPSNAAGQQGSGQTKPAAHAGSMSEGSMLSAVVTARASSGDTMLHTEVGNFRMSSRNPIPVGSQVVLELESIGDTITARVTAINGEKLASPPSVTLLPVINKPAQPINPYGGQVIAPDKAALDSEMQRIVSNLEARSRPTPATSQNMALQSGNTSAQQTAPASPLTANQITSGGAEQVGRQASANPTLFAATLASSSSLIGPKQSSIGGAAAYAGIPHPKPEISGQGAQQSGGVQIAKTEAHPEIVKLSIEAPPTRLRPDISGVTGMLTAGKQVSALFHPTNTDNVQNQGDIRFQGAVIAHTNVKTGANRTVQVFVQSIDLGNFRFQTSQPPAIGSLVSFSLSEELGAFPLPPTMGAISLFKTPHLPIMSQWENLREALNTLATHDPAAAQTLLSSQMPRVGPNLGASLLFFLAALNGGDIGKWMGQHNLQTLENNGKGELIRALRDEFATIGRLAAEPGGQDWRVLAFPFFDQEKLHQLRLYYRQHKKQGEDGEDENRFVIELDLSKTGPVQLDGLFRPKSFNLVLRSRFTLPDQMKADVTKIFVENLEITGLTGRLLFREVNPFPVHPTEEWESDPPTIL